MTNLVLSPLSSTALRQSPNTITGGQEPEPRDHPEQPEHRNHEALGPINILQHRDERAVRNNPFRLTTRVPYNLREQILEPRHTPCDSRTIDSPRRAGVTSNAEKALAVITETPEQPATEAVEPRVIQFLEEELAKFEGLAGVSHIAEHSITMRDDKPIKQIRRRI